MNSQRRCLASKILPVGARDTLWACTVYGTTANIYRSEMRSCVHPVVTERNIGVLLSVLQDIFILVSV